MPDRRWRLAALALVLGLAVLAVYVATLTPGVLGGDVGELQFVPPILSLAHPTGTPSYVLLSKAWSLLPLGSSVAWRLNLLAAVSASLAILVVYASLAVRGAGALAALAAALSLACAPTFWEQATMDDKYAFNALLVALLLFLASRWEDTRAPRMLNLLAFVYGLCLTHHRSMVLFAPPLLGYVWWHERGALLRDRRRLLRLAALFLAPFLLYLYLPWAAARGLPPGTWQPQSLADWYNYIMDTGQIGYLYVDPADVMERLAFYARTLVTDFTWLGVGLGLAGLLWQFFRRPALAALFLVSAVLHAFLAANHHLPRQWTFFIPSFIIFALWVGEGVEALEVGSERLLQTRRTAYAALLVPIAALALAGPLTSFPERYQAFLSKHQGAGTLDPWRQHVKQGEMGERLGRSISGVAENAVIVGDWEQATCLWYYQQVEGWRPDVEIIYPVERLDEAAAAGRPLYVARTLGGLSDRWHPSNAGALIALRPEPSFELPAGVSPVGIVLGDTLELAGVQVGDGPFYPSKVVPLTLSWRARTTPAHDYAVSLRLFAADGQELFRVDSQHPVLGTYPTSRWAAGEVVGDYYEIQLPSGLAPGTYTWGTIVYRALPDGGWENLKVAGTDQEIAIGGSIEVQSRQRETACCPRSPIPTSMPIGRRQPPRARAVC